MKWNRMWPALLFAAGLFLVVDGSMTQALGQQKVIKLPGAPKVVPIQPAQPAQPAVGQAAPGEPSLLPKSSAAFISIKVSDVVNHPDLKSVLEQFKKSPGALERVTELIGVMPEEIDRLTLFWPTVSSRSIDAPAVVVTTRVPYNEARVLKTLRADPLTDRGGAAIPAMPAKSAGGKAVLPIQKEEEESCSSTFEIPPDVPLFYVLPQAPLKLLLLVDERTLLFFPKDFGRSESHIALLAQLIQKKPTGPLADAIATVSNHTLSAGIHLTPLFRLFDRELSQELAPYAALTAARTGVLTGDLGQSAKFTLTLSFDDVAAARRAAPVLEEGLKVVAQQVSQGASEFKRGSSHERAIAPLMEAAVGGLKTAEVKINGTNVVATTDIEVGPAAAKAAAELLQALAEQKKFEGRVNHLKQIGIALHSYHDANGKFPGNIYNAKGEAILSWRVHLLPYLEQEALYRRFKLNEPWDSENNKPLVEMMPKVFEVPGRENPKGKTFFQAFVSPKQPRPGQLGNAWFVEGNKEGRKIFSITDGTSNSIAVVEARDAAIWSKPDDLPFGEKLPPLGAEGADRFAALFFDGHVTAIPIRIDPATLRAAITVDGGEVVSLDFDNRRDAHDHHLPDRGPEAPNKLERALPPPIKK